MPRKPRPGEPRRGPGYRNTECQHYETCLDVAAKRDYKTFNCEGCEYGGRDHDKKSVTTPKEENTRICKECKEKTTLSPNCPYCSFCMAKKSNAARTAKKDTKAKKPQNSPSQKRATKSPVEPPKEERVAKGMPKSNKPLSGPNTALTIEFGKYESILRQVEKLAGEEMRPVHLQVIYILKHYFDGVSL